MAQVKPLDVFEVTLVGSLIGQRIMNTFHYEVENVPIAGIEIPAATAIIETHFEKDNGIIERYLLCLPSNYTLDQMWIQLIGPTQRYVKIIVPQALQGTQPGNADTANISAVITRTTEKAGRSQVSSLHVPLGNSSVFMANGRVSPAQVVGLQALADLLPEQIGGAPNLSLDPVIYHGPPPKLSADRIVDAVPQQTVRVMRRRTLGLGI